MPRSLARWASVLAASRGIHGRSRSTLRVLAGKVPGFGFGLPVRRASWVKVLDVATHETGAGRSRSSAVASLITERT